MSSCRSPRSSRPVSEFGLDVSFDINDLSEQDPAWVQSREDRLVNLSDAITRLARDNDAARFDLQLQNKSNKYLRQLLDERSAKTRKQEESVRDLRIALRKSEADKAVAEGKRKAMLKEIAGLQKSLKMMFGRIQHYLPKEKVDLDADVEADVSDSDASSDSELEVSPDQAEKYELVREITKMGKSIHVLRLKIARAKLTTVMNQAERANIKVRQDSLQEMLNYYQDRLNEADARTKVASDVVSTAINPCDFEEKVVNQLEEEADEMELELNRSRTEFLGYEAAIEYHQMRSLIAANKQRRKELQLRKKKVDKSMRRRERRIARGESPISPKKGSPDKGELYCGSPLTTSSRDSRLVHTGSVGDGMSTRSGRSRRSKIERRQAKIDMDSLNLDELEEKNRQERQESEAKWRAKMERVDQLSQQLNEAQRLKVQVEATHHRVEMEKLKDAMLEDRLTILKEQQNKIYERCKQISNDMTLVALNQKVDRKTATTERVHAELERRKSHLSDLKKKLNTFEISVNTLEQHNETADEMIKELNKQLDTVVTDIEKETEALNRFDVKYE